MLGGLLDLSRSRKAARYSELRDGRDEMNLVEFPFATLSERSGKTQMLEFEVEEFDRVLRKPVVRKLTVTGDTKFGLPTSKDEEVYLGLLQLTKRKSKFSDPIVLFTRSELIQLMGWRNRDWSYHRISTALARLTGVRLFYENAWKDNTKKKYRTKGGFGLLDSFEIRDGRIRAPDGDEAERLSEFRWNSVLFDSFQSGYLKKLDYERVRTLSATARRIYRFLDKHFYPPKRPKLVYDLKTFAFEHIGISRSNDNSQIKRALTNAFTELEAINFVAPNKHRFHKVKGQRGKWEVVCVLHGYGVRSKTPQKQGNSRPTGHLSASSPTESDDFDRYMNSLPAERRTQLEVEALRDSSGFLKDTLEDKDVIGPLADTCRRQIVKAFVRTRLKQTE